MKSKWYAKIEYICSHKSYLNVWVVEHWLNTHTNTYTHIRINVEYFSDIGVIITAAIDVVCRSPTFEMHIYGNGITDHVHFLKTKQDEKEKTAVNLELSKELYSVSTQIHGFDLETYSILVC